MVDHVEMDQRFDRAIDTMISYFKDFVISLYHGGASSMGVAAKVQRNYQITLPASVRKQAHVHVGDLVDFEVREDGILIKPLVTVERSQLWFWTKRWQDEERKVQQDFRKGRVKVSRNVKEFIDELDK